MLASIALVAGLPVPASAQTVPPTPTTKTKKVEISVSLVFEYGSSGPSSCYSFIAIEVPHVRDAVGYEINWTDYYSGPEGSPGTGGAPQFRDDDAGAPAGTHRIALTGGVSSHLGGAAVDPESCAKDPWGGKRFKLRTSYAILGDRQCDGKKVPKGKFVIDGTVGYTSTGSAYSTVAGKVVPEKGVSVKVSGASSGSATTDAGGNYCVIVSKGRHVVTPVSASSRYAPAKRDVKVASDIGGVNFRRGASLIDGTVKDSAGKPASNVSVRIIGQGGKVVKTDAAGYFIAEVPVGTYTVAASRIVDVKNTDTSGKTTTTSKVESFCHADEPRKCPETKKVTLPPDQKVTFGQGCETST